jgi:AcrR family transcriptional regulator
LSFETATGIIPVLTSNGGVVPEPEQPRRRPGRPREVVRREPGTGAPLGTSLDDYQPTTRAMLEAARGIILRLGVHALTLRRVAEEAHVDVTTVTYHFGTRSGLLEALVGAAYAEPVAAFADEIRTCATPFERAQALFRTLRREIAAKDDGTVYAAIVAESLRDERLRGRLAALNEWTIRAFAEAVYGVGAAEMLRDPRALAAMQLLAAAVDGLEIHHHIDPDGFDIEAAFALLEELLPLPRAGDSGSPP